MPQSPDDPPLTDERTLEPRRLAEPPPVDPASERTTVRSVIFWSLVAVVLLAGLALFFLYADSVLPVLRTDR
ncbi:MAG TPA: hypothetical protein VMM18_10115 [Gemmatimonadaceae bacterium]|nr:hypothetical protein [Gemmatimonadaceae bacterium]